MSNFSGVYSFPHCDTEITLRGQGNELYATFETLDGFTVLLNQKTKKYEYAKKDEGRLVLSGFDAKDAPPEGFEKHLRESPEEIEKKITSSPLYKKKHKLQEKAKLRLARIAPAVSAAGAPFQPAPPSTVTIGHVVGLCLLIKFPKESNNPRIPVIPASEVSNFCNQVGYKGFKNNGSVRDYFAQVSLGNFSYKVKVAPWYTAKFERKYYTDEQKPEGQAAQELIKEALKYHDQNGFDFSDITLESGRIKALSVYYSGRRTNNWSKGLWPHAWVLKKPVRVGTNKHIQAYDYQITDMTDSLTLGTFLHENAHMVCDFPDLYDYGADGFHSSGIGAFCLMCSGSYVTETNPTKVCGYLRYRAGWIKPIPLVPGTFTLGVDQLMILRKPNTTKEYFILEYRKKEGWDSYLPGEGLAIWHIDEDGNNEYQDGTPNRHYECALLEADGKKQFATTRDWDGDANDLFPTATKTEIDDKGYPSLKWWDGTSANTKISKITRGPGYVKFKVSTIN